MSNEPKIKKGYLDKFYMFRIFEELNENFIAFLSDFARSRVLISGEDTGGKVSFNKKFDEFLDERIHEFRKQKNDGEISNFLKEDIVRVDIDNSQIPGNLLKLQELKDNLVVSQEYYLNLMVRLLNTEKQYTGISPANFKSRFLLMPFKFQYNNVVDYAGVYLTIFQNGLATLHISLPIYEYRFDDFSINMFQINFNKLFLPNFVINNNSPGISFQQFTKGKKLDDVAEIYIKYLQKFSQDVISNDYYSFNHLTLYQYANRPTTFDDEPSHNFNSSMYKILFAPISEFTEKSREENKQILSKMYHSMSNSFRYYCSTSSRTVGVYAKKIEDLIKKAHPDIKLEEIEELVVHEASITGICVPIEHILLKQYIQRNQYLFKLDQNMSLNDLIKIKEKINFDENFLFSRFAYVYGSMRGLINFLETTSTDIFQEELFIKRTKNIEEMINLKKEQRNNRITNLGVVFSLFFTSIFSIPTIESILKMLHKQQYTWYVWGIVNIIFLLLVLFFFYDRLKINTKKIINSVINKR
jgi:hypothetical protein